MGLRETRQKFKDGVISKPQFIKDMYTFHALLFEYADFLGSSDVQEIAIQKDSIIVTTREDGIRLACQRNDERCVPLEILNFGHFENEEMNLCRSICQPDWTVFDVGANIGFFSLSLMARHPKIVVYAFEPVPSTYAYLLDNIRLNNALSIFPQNIGLSNQAGECTFFVYPEGSVNSSMKDLSERESVQKIVCRNTRLDDFVADKKVVVDFLKCDVEGAEKLVLEGGLHVLRTQSPVLFVEMLRKWSAKFGYHPNDIIALLAPLGYRCFMLEEARLTLVEEVNEATLATNFFFLHSQKHAGLIP